MFYTSYTKDGDDVEGATLLKCVGQNNYLNTVGINLTT